MPATRTPSTRQAATAAERAADNDRHLNHVIKSLETAQTDLSAIGGSLGTGVRDLRRDVSKLLRDARRDVVKMRKAVQRDLGRLQKDLGAAAPKRTTGGARRQAVRKSAARS